LRTSERRPAISPKTNCDLGRQRPASHRPSNHASGPKSFDDSADLSWEIAELLLTAASEVMRYSR
jgi:hypothetical protein